LIHPYVEAADASRTSVTGGHAKALLEWHEPKELEVIHRLGLPEHGCGKEGLLDIIQGVLKYSVNTWDRGFMDKLYGSTNAVRFALFLRESYTVVEDWDWAACLIETGWCSV
jgi:glutamate decarboxylase